MFKAGGRRATLLYAALGAGMMGIWSSTLFGSGGASSGSAGRGRSSSCVAAPPPFLARAAAADARDRAHGAVLAGRDARLGPHLSSASRSTSCTRSRSWSRCRRPCSRSGCSASCSRRASSSTATRTRSRTCSSTRSGSSPGCCSRRAAARLGAADRVAAAPTWGIRAIRHAALGGGVWFPIGMCAALGVAYLAIGSVFLRNFERLRARGRPSSLT